MELEPTTVEALETLCIDFVVMTDASLDGIFSFAPNFKLVGVNPGFAFSIFSQPWEVPQHCLAMEVNVSPSTTTCTLEEVLDEEVAAIMDLVDAVPLAGELLEVVAYLFPGAESDPLPEGRTVAEELVVVAVGFFMVEDESLVAGLFMEALSPLAEVADICVAAAATMALPVAVVGVKPGNVVGNGCIGVVSTSNPSGMLAALEAVRGSITDSSVVDVG